jgi:hypothetical protein
MICSGGSPILGRSGPPPAVRCAANAKSPAPVRFFANLEPELLRLERELQDGTYRPGRYVEIKVCDPKERIVSAAPFRERPTMMRMAPRHQ